MKAARHFPKQIGFTTIASTVHSIPKGVLIYRFPISAFSLISYSHIRCSRIRPGMRAKISWTSCRHASRRRSVGIYVYRSILGIESALAFGKTEPRWSCRRVACPDPSSEMVLAHEWHPVVREQQRRVGTTVRGLQYVQRLLHIRVFARAIPAREDQKTCKR